MNYDFYHPNNIFITNYKDLDGLKFFLEKYKAGRCISAAYIFFTVLHSTKLPL